MTTCGKCGQQSSGAFCANCGASLTAVEEATSTSGTRDSAPHREGWHDESTYTGGYSSYRSHGSGNPSRGSYGSAGPASRSAAPGGAAPAPAPKDNRRGNQMLATLVGIAAVAVFALVAYLIFKPGSGGTTSNATPSVNNSVSTASSAPNSSTSTSTVTSPAQNNQPQPQQTVTETTSASSGPSLDDVPGHLYTNGNYAIGRSGSTLTVYKDNGSGAAAISTLVLKGSGGNNLITFNGHSGCTAPIIVWNSDSKYSSAAFGIDSSGQYQMFKAGSGQYDMTPSGGDGSNAGDMGVHDRNGYVAVNDTTHPSDTSNNNVFTGCNSDGTTLHWDRKGE